MFIYEVRHVHQGKRRRKFFAGLAQAKIAYKSVRGEKELYRHTADLPISGYHKRLVIAWMNEVGSAATLIQTSGGSRNAKPSKSDA